MHRHKTLSVFSLLPLYACMHKNDKNCKNCYSHRRKIKHGYFEENEHSIPHNLIKMVKKSMKIMLYPLPMIMQQIFDEQFLKKKQFTI